MRRAFTHRLLAVLIVALAGAAAARAQTDPRIEAGFKALQAGDGEQAASAFRGPLNEHPRDAVLNLGVGAAAHLLGRDDEARTLLRRALESEPRLTYASFLLGEITYAQGDVAEAIRIYERALERAPANGALRKRLEEWRRESSMDRRTDGPFSIVFEGAAEERLAAHATEVLRAAYWRIGKALGGYPTDQVTVVLYTERRFRDLTGAPEWSGGTFDSRIRIPVRGALQDQELFDRVLAHELAHAMIAGLAPRGVPAWLHEGLASYFEPESADTAARRLRAWHRFLPLDDLTGGFGRLSAQQAMVAYDESLLAATALVTRIGPSMALLLHDLDRGATVESALEQLGVGYRDLEADVRRRTSQLAR